MILKSKQKKLEKLNPYISIVCIQNTDFHYNLHATIGENESWMKVSCHEKNWLDLSTIEIFETDKEQYEHELIEWVQSDECATKCKESLIQAENSKVTIKCINNKGKKKTISCSDKMTRNWHRLRLPHL